MRNIASEIISGKFPAEAVDMGGSAVMLVAGVGDADAGVLEANLTELIGTVQRELQKNLSVSASAFVSGTGRAANLCQLYSRAQELSLLRLFHGPACMLFCGRLNLLEPKTYTYPIGKEKQLVASLMEGKTEESKKLYTAILRETADYPISVYNLAVSRLIIAVGTAVHTISSNNRIPAAEEPGISMASLSGAETIGEVDQLFFELFDTLREQMEKRKNSRTAELAAEVDTIIDAEYGNAGLSIDSISEQLGISAGYLSRQYKQCTAGTVLERVQSVRMNQAKKLLATTDMSIMEISKKVGFTSDSYFYRSFKQEIGMTPYHYRKEQKLSKDGCPLN